MTLSIDQLRLEAQAYFTKQILIFVKVFNRHGRAEFTNGFITEFPEANYFFMTDIEEPDRPAKMIFFEDLLKPGAFMVQSKKNGNGNGTVKG